MSILDTITSLNQEASVWASSSSDKGRKGHASDEPMQLVEEGEQDMCIVEEGDGQHDGKTLEDAEELASEVQALEVKTEDTQEQMDVGKEGLLEEMKVEEEETGTQEFIEEEKDKAASKTTGKPSEEKQDDDLLKSSQAKQKARERIKEGEVLYLFIFLVLACTQYSVTLFIITFLMIHVDMHISAWIKIVLKVTEIENLVFFALQNTFWRTRTWRA